MSNAILYRMSSGIPGDISRNAANAVVEAIPGDAAAAFGAYGLPGKISSGKFVPLTAGDTAVYGFLVRPYPTQGANASDPLGTAVPATSGILNALKRGYMTVKNNAGTPALDGAVYVRTANPSGAKVVGGIEAAAEPAATSAAGANTGNGTLGTLSATAAAVAGDYTVKMLTATTFAFTGPNGERYADGATGAAYTPAGLTFTVTAGGTAFVAGDSFTVTAAQNTVLIPGAKFNGPADSSGNAEIAFSI